MTQATGTGGTDAVFNFIMLGVGSAPADNAAGDLSQGTGQITSVIVLAIIFAISILVNGTAIVVLLTGRATRKTLSQGLLKSGSTC